ncbi:MAG TPA: hypothetical protein VF054_10025 [Micromonosporaceae bacterium]
MTQTKPAATQRAPDRIVYTPPETRPEPTGWVGWIVFGATMLILMGAFQFIEGLVAVLRSGYYVVAESQLAVNVDFTVWGWVHMAIGALAVITGFGLFVAQTWARVVGVILAGVSAIVNMAFIPAYPFWSLAVIALDVVVIYALVAHGREMTND